MWRWYPPSARAKFGRGWVGPYVIDTKIGPSTVRIRKGKKKLVVHLNDLKPYDGHQYVLVESSSSSAESSAKDTSESETEDSNDEQQEEGETQTRTRGGREIRLPYRYR